MYPLGEIKPPEYFFGNKNNLRNIQKNPIYPKKLKIYFLTASRNLYRKTKQQATLTPDMDK